MNLLNDKKFHEKIDDEFFQKYCSISILFNRTAKIIRDNQEIAGYRSQVLNYTVSLISYHTSRKINFDLSRCRSRCSHLYGRVCSMSLVFLVFQLVKGSLYQQKMLHSPSRQFRLCR